MLPVMCDAHFSPGVSAARAGCIQRHQHNMPHHRRQRHACSACLSPLVLCVGLVSAQPPWALRDISRVNSSAYAHDPVVTDKVSPHSYQIMYGMFLLPSARSATQSRAGFKMLEIGLGCDQRYGAGASATLWRELLPDAELWMADVDEACVHKHADSIRTLNVHALVGSQSSNHTLQRWLNESGGAFDAIIDDGGHLNSQILITFDALWPSVKEGGVYFMEDLHVGRIPDYEDTRGDAVVSDVIQAWIEQLLVVPTYTKGRKVAWGSRPAHMQAFYARARHPLPPDVAFVFCQHEACVIGKQTSTGAGPGTGTGSKRRARHTPR
mmetsp:Transcript_32218/g.69246  ORF Transcript_32218/g.69246 Transcript_32218/m.69246 type:complete len:324 (-) Transcript_32218:216-1187(-)